MKIPDEKVYRDFQRVAEMGPVVKRAVESMDDGTLDKRIQRAVTAGFEKGKENGMGCRLCG